MPVLLTSLTAEYLPWFDFLEEFVAVFTNHHWLHCSAGGFLILSIKELCMSFNPEVHRSATKFVGVNRHTWKPAEILLTQDCRNIRNTVAIGKR